MKYFSLLLYIFLFSTSRLFAQEAYGGGVDLVRINFGFHFKYVASEYKIQKVQDITEEDAKAEGCFSFVGRGPKYYHHTYVKDFKMLWNEIYNNWDENPWVWVYGFEIMSIKE
jgi:hypothetical protein